MAVKLREKKIAENRYSFYLDTWHRGKREYEFLKLYIDKNKNLTPEQREKNRANKELAEKIRADKESILDYSRFGKTAPLKANADFIKFCEQYYSTKPANQQLFYKGTIGHLKKHIKADTLTAAQLTPDVVEAFREYLFNGSGLSKTTPYSYFGRFKTLLNEAQKKGLFSQSPATNIRNNKKPQTIREYLTDAEIQLLAQTPCTKPEIKRAFLFACNTGLRHVDISRLTYQNISNDRLNFRQQKTSEPLHLPLNKNAKKLLGNITGSPDELVFNVPDVTACNVVLKQWCKDASITKNISFHIARHSFATNMLINGTDISTVSKLLGHTSLEHVMIYAKVVDKLKNEAVNSLTDINF